MTEDDGDGPARREARARVAVVAKTLGDGLPALARQMHVEIAESIGDLRGDDVILELLRASTESNVETFLHVVQHEISIDQVQPPSAAVEYGRRLAQRGVSTNALLRAYRIGQNRILTRGSAEIARTEPDREVAFAATTLFQQAAFGYVDRVAELVVGEYESERERWLANRNTVRAEMLATVLSGRGFGVPAAEAALGYRLGQNHLGLVVWTTDGSGVISDLRQQETIVTKVGESIGAEGRPLFLPQDSGLAWCWLPLGARERIDAVPDSVTDFATGAGLRLAIGRPAAGADGFRATHTEAVRTHSVAVNATGPAAMSFGDDGVEVASILVHDLESTRSLVRTALGGLAAATDSAQRLRETLEVYLQSDKSYVLAGARLYLHKNTVRYRVAKAVELRGRGLDDERIELQLALTACRRLGSAVLLGSAP